MLNNITKIKQGGNLIKGLIIDGGQTVHDKCLIDKYLAEHYKDDSFSIPNESIVNNPRSTSNIFTVENILEAIGQCNFSKAMGDDGFDGRILSNSPDLQQKVAKDVANCLNNR